MESVCGWCIKRYEGWCRVVIITPERTRLEHYFRLGFRASNNEAGYEALLAGFRTILGMAARDIEIYSDSRLVVR